MVQVDIVYEGKLCCKATHEPSGNSILTDAPKDNNGEGKFFSPTDLVGTALGTCMMTIMGMVAQRENIDLSGSTVRVLKEMSDSPPRRIAKLTVTFHVPRKLTQEQEQKLRNAAMTCPVHKSLHPDVQTPIEFKFG
ncbi:MAG TPA: OsmC family protein [Candidatus Obscuribacterales bacterium]